MYKIKKGAIPYLEENGFKKTYDGAYKLRFPVYFYKKTPIIFCTAYIHLEWSKEIRLEVEKNGMPYSCWYMSDNDYASIVINKINKEISNKMHKIGARHYAD